MRNCVERNMFVAKDVNVLQSNHCIQFMLICNHVADLEFIISDNTMPVLRHKLALSHQSNTTDAKLTIVVSTLIPNKRL